MCTPNQSFLTGMSGTKAVMAQVTPPASTVSIAASSGPVPDPNAFIPDRGYGFRYGSGKTPETTSPDGEQLSQYDSPIKGNGYYGMIPRTDGTDQSSSELSIGVKIGNQILNVPSMAPGLNKAQLSYLTSTPEDQLWSSNKSMMSAIADNAATWAKKRLSAKLPVYATASEEGKFKPVDDGQ